MKTLPRLLRPDRCKLALVVVAAVLTVLILFLIPTFGYWSFFKGLPPILRAINLSISLVVDFVVYYLLVSGGAAVYDQLRRRRNLARGELVLALVLVLLCNPLSLWLIRGRIIRSSPPPPAVAACGWEIADFQEFSKAPDSGLWVGDVILQIEGQAIKDTSSLQTLLGTKKSGERVTVTTTIAEVVVELVVAPGTGKTVLGLNLRPRACPSPAQ